MPFDLTIISHVADGCSVTFHEPQVAMAWLRLIVNDIKPDAFMAITKIIYPNDPDIISNFQDAVKNCIIGKGI